MRYPDITLRLVRSVEPGWGGAGCSGQILCTYLHIHIFATIFERSASIQILCTYLHIHIFATIFERSASIHTVSYDQCPISTLFHRLSNVSKVLSFTGSDWYSHCSTYHPKSILPQSISPVCRLFHRISPICRLFHRISPICRLFHRISPICRLFKISAALFRISDQSHTVPPPGLPHL